VDKMGPLTRSAVKQRATVARIRSSVEIDMPPGSGGGAGGGVNGDAASDEAARTSLHWSEGSSGGSDDDGAVSAKRRGRASRRRGGGSGAPGGDEAIEPYEWGNMALLVLLYAMQGIPLGLTMGTM
jgi:hypothetical protein